MMMSKESDQVLEAMGPEILLFFFFSRPLQSH